MAETSLFPDVGAPVHEQAAGSVTLVLWQGDEQRPIAAHPGETLLRALRRAEVPLAAICGGKGACGTCRMHIVSDWHDRLPAPSRRELRLLAHIQAVPGDRLSCQIPIENDLDGLVIHTISDTKGHE